MPKYSMEEEQLIKNVWACIEKPLEQYGLPWAEKEFNIPLRMPISVSIKTGGNILVQIDTELIAKDGNVARDVVYEIEEVLKKDFELISSKFSYGFRDFILNPGK